MYIPIIITLILISLDGLFVGMSLKLQQGFKYSFLFIMALIIFNMCMISYFVAGALISYINFDVSWILGGVFLLLGIRHLFSKDEDKSLLSLGTIIALGFIISIDGFIATAVLTIDHGKTLLTPILASLGHLIFLFAGCYLVNFIKTSYKVHKYISASCLFLIAILNFVGIL